MNPNNNTMNCSNNQNIVNNNNNNNDNKIVEMVYSLLEMLRLSSPEEMSTKLLLMSQSPQICREMRQYGCLPLLIQLIHQQTNDKINDNKQLIVTQQELRQRASKTFRNIIVNSSKSRREVRVLRLIEDLRSFVDFLRVNGTELKDDFIDHPNSSVAYLLKVSFDEEHRNIIGLMGGVYAIAEVIQYDFEYHRNARNNSCVTLRRYSLMALINLTFGDSQTKSLLATIKPFMKALVQNLESPAEELRQVVASLLRNLSWKADYMTKQILREVGAVTYLTQAGLEATKESTLKSILSALWNLTAHCAPNKADFCRVDGALSFLISTLTYCSNNNSITIVENGGGILRNISSHIVVNEEYREVLRKHNTIAILLEQLKSPSITVVSNSCVTLWNLSARCPKDQQTLWELGAVSMLRNLTNSRHKMISMGASATLKNLFSSPIAPNNIQIKTLNSSTCSIPSLQARKLKALKDDINCNLSDTFDNIESPKVSPSHETYKKRCSTSAQTNIYLPGRMYTSFSGHINPYQVSRSSSHDSIGSTHSEPVTKLSEINQNLTNIYPFVPQIVPQMYSTLSSNDSRNSDKDLDISSDFDVYCGESNSQLNVSNASVKSPFTDTELDVDPEPTDYSQRYKERPIDDFIAPRSNKPEVAGSEDSIKVYITEGTPLNFSLASSLSDLRDSALSAIDEEKNSILANIENSDNSSAKAVKTLSEDKKTIENKPKVLFKKPILPPKPKLSILPKKESIDGNNNSNHNKSQTEAKTVTFVENRVNSSVSINSIVSIDISNENVCEETPLMFSRSSSLASLSDCEVKSDICQSSVVSEFSRRPSEVVSPSDLPDSPLDSPRSLSPKPKQLPTDRQTVSCNDQKEILKPIDQQLSDKPNENTVFEEKPINFATEDTPAVFSLSTSLSSLNEELNASNDNEIDGNQCNYSEEKQLKQLPMTAVEYIVEVNDIKVETISTSSEDEGEDELLAACISSGMKKTSNETTNSHNSLKRTDSKSVVTHSSLSKQVPILQQRKNSIGTGPIGPPLARSAPDGQSSYLEKDTLKIYDTEGTEQQTMIFSKTSSISELSISNPIGKSRDISVNQSQNHSADESEDEEILLKCIASGMTANRNQNTLTKTKRSPKTPKTTPNASPNTANDKNLKKELNADQTQRFFVEDTPIELSQCHSSLSSLSIESDDHFEDQKLLSEVISRGMNQKKTTKNFKTRIPQKRSETPKATNFDDTDDTITYTICQKSQRSIESEDKKSLMVCSAMTDSSCVSDLDNMKPPSLMDNSMFSSTESFSYRQITPIVNRSVKRQSDDNQILLDNIKPPSLMEDISMSQSCASITSDISDIAFDSEIKNEKIAEMAKNCAVRINTMTYSADNSDSDTIDKICPSKPTNLYNSNNIGSKIDYELSDTELSEELPVDNVDIKAISQNDIVLDVTSSSSVTLPLESPTICADIISDFDEENRIIRREKEILFSGRRISPIGSEDVLEEQTSFVSDDSDPDTRATYNINSPRRPQIVRPVVRKNKSPKECLKFVSTQPSVVRPSIPTARNKYMAKQTRTSALRASRSHSAETHFDGEIVVEDSDREKRAERHPYSVHRSKHYIDYLNESNSDFSVIPKNTSKLPKPQKTKEKSILSNMRSKFPTSLSSHTLGSSNASLSSNSSNGVTPSCASFSRKFEVQSRIASLWKRSKSSSNEGTDKSKDLSRSISARRSFGKSGKISQNSSLMRSSTYEKLPQSPEEAINIETNESTAKKTANYSDKYNNNNNNYIEKRESTQRRQQIDKSNGNSDYLLSKHSKSSSKHKTDNNLIVNFNMINETTGSPKKHNNKSVAKTSSKSRRTCLVTAV